MGPLVNNFPLADIAENGAGTSWYAAYTVPRHEKTVASQLAGEIETYLPLYRSVRRWNGRRAEIDLPLFPNYVFVRFAVNERIKVVRHPSVVSIVSFGAKLACLPDSEIELLRNAISVGKVFPHPFLLTGKRVRVKSGPLSGLEATV